MATSQDLMDLPRQPYRRQYKEGSRREADRRRDGKIKLKVDRLEIE